jgi:hypothetical protein
MLPGLPMPIGPGSWVVLGAHRPQAGFSALRYVSMGFRKQNPPVPPSSFPPV